jgi:hypothetical protein
MKSDHEALKPVVQAIMLATKENVASRKAAEAIHMQLTRLVTDGSLKYLTDGHTQAFFAALPEEPKAILELPSVPKFWEACQYATDFSGEATFINSKDLIETGTIARSVDLETLQYDQVRIAALDYTQALQGGNDQLIEEATLALSLFYPKSRIKYLHWVTS